MRKLIPTAVTCLLALCAGGGLAASAHASGNMESMFQDDNQLIHNTPAGAAKAMDTLQTLGVDRVRVTVLWRDIAPAFASATKPAFDASDPAAYPAASWSNYDQIVRLARARNIAVNFNVTAPAPDWATGTPDRPELHPTYDPNAKEYGLFVQALGTRYSGSYRDPAGELLPRVRYWSIWNEPNQGGWLTPQWARDPRAKNAWVETSPVLYRSLVDAAWTSLQGTGHGGDTILIGDTAPKGTKDKGESRPIAALHFLRELYCLDGNLQAYKGTSAQLRSCPVGPTALAAFPQQHPGLFQATGYAHHPYELIFSPTTKPADKDAVTIANLPNLSKILTRIYQRYRQPIPGKARSVPLYLTEFGNQTNPPDPTGVSLDKQAAYNNQAEYMAYRDRNVMALSQFLLVDDTSIANGFQTGLETVKGKLKPGYAAYALPIFLPSRRIRPGQKLTVWGVPRAAPNNVQQTVLVEGRGGHGSPYRRIGTLKSRGTEDYVFGNVRVSGSGAVRLAWKGPGGRVLRSRAVTYTVVKKK